MSLFKAGLNRFVGGLPLFLFRNDLSTAMVIYDREVAAANFKQAGLGVLHVSDDHQPYERQVTAIEMNISQQINQLIRALHDGMLNHPYRKIKLKFRLIIKLLMKLPDSLKTDTFKSLIKILGGNIPGMEYVTIIYEIVTEFHPGLDHSNTPISDFCEFALDYLNMHCGTPRRNPQGVHASANKMSYRKYKRKMHRCRQAHRARMRNVFRDIRLRSIGNSCGKLSPVLPGHHL
jgi:hypothetical protein